MLSPSKRFPEPPFPDQSQEWPGDEAEMQPVPIFIKDDYKPADKLDGKVMLITGGDSGIGRAVAVAAAMEGARVAISYLSEDADAQETKRVIEENRGESLLLPGDIQDKAHCQSIVSTTVQHFGGLDVLVNNAAFQQSHDSLEEFSETEIDQTFRTNVYSPLYLSSAAAKHFKTGSSIINTVSIQAYTPSPPLIPYAATKAALLNMTKSLAQYFASKGVRVNAVAPGPVWTPLITSTMPQGKVRQFGDTSWFGRPAQPAELAPLFIFLASDDASYVTGQVYGATGQGWP
jgi:NAD(P)-dependent dehydrogenase (short-subunit alcohol dehydrogenase family)